MNGVFCYRRAGDQHMQGSEGTQRADIYRGARVRIVQKHHQATGELTEGVVADILTKSSTHPHGIKVRLESGDVGRVKAILMDSDGG